MNILYLGTSAAEGIPAIFCSCTVCEYARENGGKDVRTRASMLIDNALLIDLTPDLLSQAAAAKRSIGEVKAVLFTHSHKENCHPWDLRHLRPPYSLKRPEQIVTILGSSDVMSTVDRVLGERESALLAPIMQKCTLEAFVPKTVDDYTITALAARHSVGAFCFLIEKDGKAILYGNDTGYFPEDTWDYLDGRKIDLVSLDCTNLFGVETENHMNMEDNITTQRRLFQLGCAGINTKFYSTQFCHCGGMNHRQIDEHMRLYGFHAAYDGLSIEL